MTPATRATAPIATPVRVRFMTSLSVLPRVGSPCYVEETYLPVEISHQGGKADRCQRPPPRPFCHEPVAFPGGFAYGVPVSRTCMTFLYVVQVRHCRSCLVR